jgi:CRP/FNR family transcriptional regulator, cyclic AMP receptor protein
VNPSIEPLQRAALFQGLRPAALELLLAIATEEEHKRGTFLFRQGESGERLYLIQDGKVRISRNVSGAGEEALAILGPGEVFGEMALLDESPRSADAIVHESCRLLSIPKDAFDDLLFSRKELAYEVLWGFVRLLSTRLRETNDKLTFLSVSGRFG